MADEIEPIGTDAYLPVLRRFPEALQAYQELVQERNILLEDDRKHFKGAMWYLMKRKAPKEEIQALREERETRNREIVEEFHRQVKELVKGLLDEAQHTRLDITEDDNQKAQEDRPQ